MVEHVPWVERCPNGVSQYCVPLHLAHKVCIHGLIQYKWPECWLAFMAKQFFQVLRSLFVCGRSCFMSRKVSKWSQSVLCTSALGSENVYSWFDPVQMARMLTCLYGKTVFQVLRSLFVCGRSCSMSRKVSKWSQSVLCTSALGSENVYSWFDPVQMARMLTCLYGETDFPVVEEPCCLW